MTGFSGTEQDAGMAEVVGEAEWDGRMMIGTLTADDNDNDDCSLWGIDGGLKGLMNTHNLRTLQSLPHLQMNGDNDSDWLNDSNNNEVGSPCSDVGPLEDLGLCFGVRRSHSRDVERQEKLSGRVGW